MKKKYLFGLLLSASAFLWACNNAGEGSSNNTTDSSSTTTSSTSNATGTTTDTSMRGANGAASSSATTTTASSTPLDAQDKDFVMKAANGGMMEVQLGQYAQENAANQRVKDFGSMMVRDHSKANGELKTIANNKGVTLPDAVMGEEKNHMDMLMKKKGKEFDQAYMNMMVTDHKKDINEFEKESNNAKDADLKGFATQTLPILRMHLDSAQAINKSKM